MLAWVGTAQEEVESLRPAPSTGCLFWIWFIRLETPFLKLTTSQSVQGASYVELAWELLMCQWHRYPYVIMWAQV